MSDSTSAPVEVSSGHPDAAPQFVQTPSQTVGPFFGYALPFDRGGELVDQTHESAVRLHGRVFDGDGVGIPDALLELWQPDESGVISAELGSRERDGYTFTGFGRTATTRAGDYTFTTVKPGSTADGPPYALVTIFARGLLHHLFTRAYFVEAAGTVDSDAPDAAAVSSSPVAAEPGPNGDDALLRSLPDDRRPTLFAVADGPRSYRFDIHLQGAGETVFLDFDA